MGITIYIYYVITTVLQFMGIYNMHRYIYIC